MAAEFDKFAWIRAVSADSRLAASDRLILVNVALFSVLGGQGGEFSPPGTFSTKQTTIAERCGTTARQVRRAITAGRSNGYLELVEERQRGRGYHRGDEHRLIWPTVIPDNLSAINDGIADKSVRNTGQNGQEYRTESTRIADNANSLTSINDTPKDIEKDIEKGGGKDAAIAAPPSSSIFSAENSQPPSRYCLWHPGGIDKPCRECGDARRQYEAWEAEVEREQTRERKERDRREANWVGSPLPKPDNHEDAFHPETWEEWVAELNIPNERPTGFCTKHPYGGPPCGACGAQHDLELKWVEERKEWNEWNRDLRAQIKSCALCDNQGRFTDDEGFWWCYHTPVQSPQCKTCRDGGIVLNHDGKPGSQIRICHHDGSWHIANDEELKAVAEIAAREALKTGKEQSR